MPDIQSNIIGAGSAFAGLLAYTFYKVYKGREETASRVKNIHVWQPDLELFDQLSSENGQRLDYVAVEGTVKELNRSLRSHHGPEEGVILKSTLVEHKSKRQNGFWSDVKRELRNNMNSVPFVLKKQDSDDPKFNIEVVEPLSASQIEDALEVTYDRFESHKASLVEVGLERLFGEATKGIQETESMLLTGTSLLGIGRVALHRGKIRLEMPHDGQHAYIITKMSLRDLVRHYESQSRIYKVLTIISTLLGGGLLVYLIWKKTKLWLELRKQRREFEEMRRTLRQAHGDNSGADDHPDTPDQNADTTCVVCLSEQRQIIVVPCGHVALCVSCAEALPSPKRCPVCRGAVERFLPVYYS